MSVDNQSNQTEKSLKHHLLVEVGWEVCWQLGGIYTVLRTKAPATVDHWDDRYCLVGPYNEQTATLEFEATPLKGYFGSAVKKLQARGITVHHGRWLVTGNPRVILIDFLKHFNKLADYKYFFWKNHYIDGGDEPEVNDPILFGYLVSEFFECLEEAIEEGIPEEELPENGPTEFPVVAQFHEWMAGVAIPELSRRKLKVASVFHTHATLLGRYMAPSDSNLYHHLQHIDPYAAATSHGILPRFGIERAAAWSSTIFTTLSDVTAAEAEHFVGRKVDLLLPNGLNINRFEAIHEFQNLHAKYKKKLHDFVRGHFFPSYTFDINKTLFIFTSGRYEYTNKGIDLFVESLARLNHRLKLNNDGTTVVAFIITRAAVKGINVNVLKSRLMYNELEDACETISNVMSERLFSAVAEHRIPERDELLDEDSVIRLKRMNHAWRREELPSISTHDMQFDAEDPILNQLRTCGLFNNPDDPVKVVYHPEFVKSTNPLFRMDYDQFVRGSHLGVFPSYYEPWGYTPMECAALGIPSISSDLAGFGTYIQREMPDHEERGLMMLERRYKGWHESAELLTDKIEKFVRMSQRERIVQRNMVESTSQLFDWKQLIRFYMQSYEMAVQKFRETRIS